MKRICVLTVIIVLGVFLVSCQGEAEPTAVPELVQETAMAVPEVNEEPTAVPEATAQPTAMPDNNEEPTAEEAPPQPTDRPVVEPPAPEEAGILPMDHFYIDAAGLAATWGHTIAQGTTLDLNYPPGNNGIPPHIVVGFGGPDEQADMPSSFSPFEAQGRILPVNAYIDMYEATANDSVKTQVEKLTSILE